MWRVAFGGLLLLACATYGERAEEVQASLVGSSGSRLLACLGPPGVVYREADAREVWVYEMPLATRAQDVTIDVPSGSATGALRPGVVGGSSQTEALTPGTCRLVFRVDADRIVAFEAVGRTYDNLNANARCTLLARPCAPPAADP